MYSLLANKFFFSIFLSFCLYNLLYNIKPLIKAKSDLHIYDLKINHLSNPLGIDITKNSFSFLSDSTGPFKVSIISQKTNQIIESKKILLQNCNSFYFKKPLEYQINELEFETASKLDSKFISPKNKNLESPIFIKEFTIDMKNIIKARLYITGLGLYQAFINDKKVGKGYLTPGYNDYDHYLRYQTYDISKLIKDENKIEVHMGNGWYKGVFGLRKKIFLEVNINYLLLFYFNIIMATKKKYIRIILGK